MPYNDLLACKMKGIAVIDGESFYERITGKLLVEKILPSWLVFSDGFKKSATARLVKRTTDLLFSLLISALLFPFLAVAAVAIKLDSKGPVVFKQERVGEHGRIYEVYKFRSMIESAEADSGPVWAREGDPRITRVGKVIRTSLELPPPPPPQADKNESSVNSRIIRFRMIRLLQWMRGPDRWNCNKVPGQDAFLTRTMNRIISHG